MDTGPHPGEKTVMKNTKLRTGRVFVLRHKREVPFSILGKILGNYQVTYSFCPHSVALGSTQPLTEVSKVRQARRANNSALLVVPNVKLRMEAQHSILPLNLHDLLRESFIFNLLKPSGNFTYNQV
jgi:hypothetical protein